MAGLMSTGSSNNFDIVEHTYQEYYKGDSGIISGNKSIPVKKGEVWLFVVVVYGEWGSGSLTTPDSVNLVDKSFSNRFLLKEIIRICKFTADTTCSASLNAGGNLYHSKGYFYFVRLQ